MCSASTVSQSEYIQIREPRESKLIAELLSLTGITKTHTTAYHHPWETGKLKGSIGCLAVCCVPYR